MNTKAKIYVLAMLLAGAVGTVAADTKANWDNNCAKCHGVDGKGQTRMGKQSGAKDYTDPKVQAEIKDDNALKAIKDGLTIKGKEVMKPFGGKLSEAESKDLIGYVRAFAKK